MTPTGALSPRLFVSYAHSDLDYTRRLCDRLAADGLPVWADVHLEWGEDFVEAVRRTIRTACGIIVVMSPGSDRSRFVRIEILEGLVHDRPFLPILLDGDPLFLLRSSQYFDARAGKLPGEPEIRRIRRFCGLDDVPRKRMPPTVPVPTTPGDPAMLPGQPAGWLDEVEALLAQGRFGAADLITTSVLLEPAGRLKAGWLRAHDAPALPLPLLRRLDELWQKGSAGHFGFTRQAALLERSPAGAPVGGGREFFALADALRWRLDEREVIPRYGRFIAAARYPEGYPDGFFPTLRNAQIEVGMGWINQWRQSVMATHLRLRESGSL